MRIIYIVLLIHIINISTYSQEMDFRCDNKLFSVRYETWIDPIQICDDKKHIFYFDVTDLNEIPRSDLKIINKTRQSLIERGGEKFYNKLILKSIIVSERPNKCDGRKYTLRYIFPLDSVFYYRFSMTYDREGNLLSNYLFPDFSRNENILNIIDKCTAISIALANPIFRDAYNNSEQTVSRQIDGTNEWEILGSISNMKLVFDNHKNIWAWKLFSETNFEGETENESCKSGSWLGKVIEINAHDSTIISVDDYREYKSVLSFRRSSSKKG